MTNLIDSITENEGFEQKPYIDVLVAKAPEHHGIPPDELEIIQKHLDKLKLTFGYGLTYITKEEALLVSSIRLKDIASKVKHDYPYVDNGEVLEILTEMAYQMGITGLRGFKKMHQAIQYKHYGLAAAEGLNSKWNRQTPNRAKKLMQRLANIA